MISIRENHEDTESGYDSIVAVQIETERDTTFRTYRGAALLSPLHLIFWFVTIFISIQSFN